MKPSSLIWLASYPKSGSTWFRILLANLRLGRKAPADTPADIPVDVSRSISRQRSLLSRESFDDMTMFESGLLRLEEIDRLRPAVYAALASECSPNTWEKVHYAWSRSPSGEPVLGCNSARAVVYLVRDPRDVAVSWAYHLNLGIDLAIDLLNSNKAMLCISGKRQHPHLQGRLGNWSRHVAGWLEQKDLPVHVIRYESLHGDTAATFAGALRFAGEQANRDDVERAVHFSRFSELKEQEKKAGFCESSPAGASPFFRRGQTGNWREELSGAQAERIVNEHGEMMRRLDYPT